MKRSTLIAIVLPLLALIFEAQAQAAPPPDISRVVGADRATCTIRICRYKVTCYDPSGGDYDCLFNLALTNQGRLLTRPVVCIAFDPDECPYPRAKLEILDSGETRALKLKTIEPGKQEIKRYLEKGTRKIKRGAWEANRADLIGPSSDEDPQPWEDAGFSLIEVLGGYLVFEIRLDGVKISLKR